MNEQIPTIGRIVHYKLSAQDVVEISRRRTTAKSIADRLKTQVTRLAAGPEEAYAWPAGAQAHIGNDVHEGDVHPMVIVKTWGTTSGSAVNGQVFLDGNDVFWATNRTLGEQPGTFSWPVAK